MEPLGNVLKRAQLVRETGTEPSTVSDVCPVCHGAGYLRHDVPVEDDRFGELIICECTRRALEQRRLERLVEKSNLGELQRLTFENFVLKFRDGPPPPRTPDDAFRRSQLYAENPEGWLMLFGAFGTGKTHLAAAIANRRLAKGEPAVFIVVPDLLDHLRSTFSPSSEVTYDDLFETVRNTPLLILDDFGTQTSTPWAQEKLYQIVNHRYNRALPTVITTNLSPDEIEPRLWSRIGDSQLSKVVEIRDIDKRVGITRGAEQYRAAPTRKAVRKVREDDRL